MLLQLRYPGAATLVAPNVALVGNTITLRCNLTVELTRLRNTAASFWTSATLYYVSPSTRLHAPANVPGHLSHLWCLSYITSVPC